MTNLSNQTAVVTGASSGIGKAIALGLAAQGSKVCLVGRNLETLDQVAKNAKVGSQHFKCYKSDLTLDEDVQKLKGELQRDFGQIEILVHSAGVISLGSVETSPVEVFDWQFRTNVRAPYFLTQNLLPLFRLHHGQIVFINSSAGLRAGRNMGQYAATKFALKAVADSLRDEVNKDGVRVLSVYPGRTATPMQASVYKTEGRPYEPERLMQPEDVASTVINSLILPQSAEMTEMFIRPLIKCG
ncbi:MAG: SDR family oxidoreductase [Planctomycetes bacterium]|nr:SDR family oxidoreductase [Planctomycetota bacterium]